MPLVEYAVKDGIARISLQDPPANTYSREMIRHEMIKALDGAILDARFDPAVHGPELTGAGESFF